MSFTNDEKKVGRFIKKGSKVFNKVALTDFSFDEICDSPVVNYDNSDSSIIHQKYHEDSELRRGVVESDSFNDDLMSDAQRRPVLHPIDFTETWRKEMTHRKAKVTRQNYDEDFFYDDVDVFGGVAPAAKPNDNASSVSAEVGIAAEDTVAEDQSISSPEGPTSEPPAEKSSQVQSMNIVGKAIRKLQSTDEVDNNGDAIIDAANEGATEHQDDEQAGSINDESDFIPVSGETDGDADPETHASNEYKQRVTDKFVTTNVNTQDLIEEAKSKGYEDGFRLGEEKGTLEAKEKSLELFAHLSELFGEFSSLKKEVLSNVQQNFYEISQAIAETLIKREFTLDPNTFAMVVRRAIDESVQQDNFKLKVHPDTYDTLQRIDDKLLLPHLVKDESVAIGNFKIESNLSVIEGDVAKLIQEYLDQANLELFDSEDKAG